METGATEVGWTQHSVTFEILHEKDWLRIHSTLTQQIPQIMELRVNV